MTLLYRSTRSGDRLGSFTDILLEGLAPDGGLAVPERTPGLPADLEQLSKMPYPALAAAVVGSYATDIAQTDLLALTQRAYTAERFGTNQIAPLTQLGMVGGTPMSLLELSNGPTLAFKDMAMQLLGQLFEFVLAKRSQTLNILGATSGDTGSAAEHAMRGKRGISVFMLSPSGRMSAFQRAQMFSLQDPNIHNFSVPGSFDDCQDMVKAVSEDLTFKSRHRICSVNSINLARGVGPNRLLLYGLFPGHCRPRRAPLRPRVVLRALWKFWKCPSRPHGPKDGTSHLKAGCGDQ